MKDIQTVQHVAEAAHNCWNYLVPMGVAITAEATFIGFLVRALIREFRENKLFAQRIANLASEKEVNNGESV